MAELHPSALVRLERTAARVQGRAALALFEGVPTNAVSMTCRANNATTFTWAVNQCTWVGLTTNGNAGRSISSSDHKPGGGHAVLGVCNAYNQVPAFACVVDTSASWTTGRGNLDNEGAGAGANNRITVLSCNGTINSQRNFSVAFNWPRMMRSLLTVGLNSTGVAQTVNCNRGIVAQDGTQGLDFTAIARCDEVPPPGLNFIQVMQANNGLQKFVGSGPDELLVGQWVR